MSKISIISKTTHQVLQTLDTASEKNINLTENSAVILDIPKEDVAKIIREGNSAVITLRNGETIVIQNYFNDENTADNSLAFVDESGKMYWAEFTDANGAVTDTIKYHLIDDVEPLLYNDDNFAGLILPWLGGAAAIGGIAAAASGGGDGGNGGNNGDTTPPAKPDINPINPKDPITGTGEEGSEITVTYPDGSTATTTVKEDGTWEVPNPGDLKDGDEITAEAKDPAGNVSDKDTETVDGIPPETPNINPINPKDPITGTGEEGSEITVTYPDGSTATTTVKEDGTWEVSNPGDLKDGDEVTAEAKDPAGNVSDKDTETVDGIPPETPNINPINPKDPITGTGEEGSEITVTYPDGSTATTTVKEDGTWEVPNPGDLKDGDEITAEAKDPAGNVSDKDTETVDGIPPETPNINPINPKDPITGTGEEGSEITVTYPDGSTATTTVKEDGTWEVPNPGDLKDGDEITAEAKDPAGNVSDKDKEIVDGNIPVTDIDPVGPNSPAITGTAEPGTTVTVTYPNGNTAAASVDDQGKWSVPNPGNLKDGEEITAIAKDAAGNTSAPAKEIVDGVGPITEINPIGPNTPVSGTGEPESTITVTFPNGDTVTTTVKADGTWEVPNPGLQDGDEVKAIGTDKVNNQGPEATEIVDGVLPITDIDPIGPNLPEITGTGLAGAVVTVTFPDKSTASTTIGADGKWSVANPGNLQDGDIVTAVSTKLSTTGPEATEIVDGVGPNTTIDPINATDPITGTGEEGSTVTVTYPDGNTVTTTVGEDGTWSVVNPGLQDGDEVKAVGTDPVGNVGPEVVETVDGTLPNTPEIDEVLKEDVTIHGTSDVGTIVHVSINGGTIVTVVTQADGTWEIPNPGVANGDVITAYATDAANNKSGTTSLTVYFITDALIEAPLAYDDVGTIQGSISAKGVTNDDKPEFSGTGAISGALIKVYANDVVIGSTIAEADGTWTLTPTEGLADQSYNFTATQTERGIESAKSPVLDFTVDTVAPVIQEADLNDAGTQVAGQTEANASIEIRNEAGDQILGTAVADENGRFTVDLNAVITSGAKVQITATDEAGNSSAAHVISDTTPPAPVELLGIYDDVANPGAGAYNQNFMTDEFKTVSSTGVVTYHTNDKTPTFQGLGEVGATVEVYLAGRDATGKLVPAQFSGTAVVDADGHWQFTSPDYGYAGLNYMYRQVDSAGNASVWSDPIQILMKRTMVIDHFSGETDTFGQNSAKFALGYTSDSISFVINPNTVRIYGQNGVTDTSNSIHVLDHNKNVIEGVQWSTQYEGEYYMLSMQLPAGYDQGYSVVVSAGAYSDYAGYVNKTYSLDNLEIKPMSMIVDTQDNAYNIQNGWVTNDSTPTWSLSGPSTTTKVLIRSTDGSYYEEVEIIDHQTDFPITTPLAEGVHSFEFSYIYSHPASAKEIQSPWSSPFTFTVDSKAYIIQGGVDFFDLTDTGYEKAVFNLLKDNDATGGNNEVQVDEWTGFHVATSEADASKDVLDVSSLLNLKDVTEDNISEFLTVSYREGDSGKHTVIKIDRDGSGDQFQSTDLLVLKNVDTTIEQLLQHNQIIY